MHYTRVLLYPFCRWWRVIWISDKDEILSILVHINPLQLSALPFLCWRIPLTIRAHLAHVDIGPEGTTCSQDPWGLGESTPQLPRPMWDNLDGLRSCFCLGGKLLVDTLLSDSLPHSPAGVSWDHHRTKLCVYYEHVFLWAQKKGKRISLVVWSPTPGLRVSTCTESGKAT